MLALCAGFVYLLLIYLLQAIYDKQAQNGHAEGLVNYVGVFRHCGLFQASCTLTPMSSFIHLQRRLTPGGRREL